MDFQGATIGGRVSKLCLPLGTEVVIVSDELISPKAGTHAWVVGHSPEGHPFVVFDEVSAKIDGYLLYTHEYRVAQEGK